MQIVVCMVDMGGVAASGWRLIVVAAMANLVFKAGMVGLIGHRRLLAQIAVLFAVVAVSCRLLRKSSAHVRYLLWLLVVVKCLT